MTHEEVMAMMEEIGLPYAYHHFAEGESPEPPFAVFLYPGSSNFSADGKVYFKADRLNIEIYTDKKYRTGTADRNRARWAWYFL